MENSAARSASIEGSSIPSLRRIELARPIDDPDTWRADPDVVTMERLRDGDVEAFRVLFSKYRGAITRFAYRFIHSRDRAEEVAQTVFLQLFLARARYQPRARFAAFLYRIATNLCLNELRRFDYSGRIASLDVTAGDSTDPGSSIVYRLAEIDSAGPVRRLACREAAAAIVEVLDRLPPNQRRALLLSRVDGFSYQEVAENLQSSVATVRGLIWRATATLRKSLAEVL